MEEKTATPVIPAKTGIQMWDEGTGFPIGSGMTRRWSGMTNKTTKTNIKEKS